MKYPFALALVILLNSCDLYKVEKEVEEKETIEYVLEIGANKKSVAKKNYTRFNYRHHESIQLDDLTTTNVKRQYIKTVFHKLYILYQSLDIDKRTIITS